VFKIVDYQKGEDLKDETGRSTKRFPTKGSAKIFLQSHARRNKRKMFEFEIVPIPKDSKY